MDQPARDIGLSPGSPVQNQKPLGICWRSALDSKIYATKSVLALQLTEFSLFTEISDFSELASKIHENGKMPDGSTSGRE
ncbi:MAG: hypothetical protein VX438_12930 [Planctomycetota bacterium]|nr:hypothetical protein [Planctomycetota bacterium]